MAHITPEIELNHDEFIYNLDPDNRPQILGAFGQAVRKREVSNKGKNDLASSTCREVVDKVEEVFRSNRQSDPLHGSFTIEDECIKLQFRGYTQSDPATKQQKALTLSFFKQQYNMATTKQQTAVALLCIAAFFWACRSCEFSTVKGERRTKICRIRNIRFFNGRRELSHYDPNLINAERVTWTFEDQKNLEKDVTIPHDNNNEPLMNPVRALASTVQRILSYPGTTIDTTLCTYYHNGKLIEFSQEDILASLRKTANSIGKDRLGYNPEEIGTKSIRSAAAMSMFMDDTPVFMIMLMGRWSSDAFLKYIRCQDLEFTRGC